MSLDGIQTYADPSALALDALSLLLPPKRETVADYALGHRWLHNAGGGYVGRWRHDMVPYTVEPMRCLTSLQYLTMAIVGPGQSAKTVVAENYLLHSVGADPADLLWYMQTDDAVEAYVKQRINPMIDAHDEMRENQGTRAVDDSLHFKQFRGMRTEFLSATLTNMINKSAPRIILDEIDAYSDELGDVLALANIRRQTFGSQSMIVATSHPDKARGMVPERDWLKGIMAIYADSDRRMWYWPCPHCGAWSSPCPGAQRVMTIEYDADATLDEIVRTAHLRCPVNDCRIEDKQRRAMNMAAFRAPHFGGWIGEGQQLTQQGKLEGDLIKRATAGFWVVGAMSPFIIGGIGGLARARVKAEREREVSGEDQTLREVMVKGWGFPYAPPRNVGSIDAQDLADRAEDDLKLGFVPNGARLLVAAVDCQVGFFEFLVRAFGVEGESWIIDRGRLLADPATSKEDWEQLLGLFARRYPLASDPTKSMAIRAMGYDSAGAPGVTNQAYEAWKRWRRGHVARLYGKIGSRDAWSIIPLKGASGANAVKLQVTYPDTQRRANVQAGRGEVPVASFNPNLFKDDLSGQLQKGEAGPWFVHFPWELRSKEPPHVFFEQAVAEHRLQNGRWEKIHDGARNEALDLLVMTHVVAHLHGLSRIPWERPPGWAQTLDKNSAVSGTETGGATPVADAAPAVKLPPAPGERPPDTTEKKRDMRNFIDKFK